MTGADTDGIAKHFRDGGISDFQVVSTAMSLDQLSVQVEGIQKDLDAVGLRAVAEAGIGELGYVTVDVEPAWKSAAEDVISRFGPESDTVFRVRVVKEMRPSVDEACNRNSNIRCDPPLRGSIWMYQPDDTRVCSAGFNVRRFGDNAAHMLTAGHCYRHPAAFYSRFGSNNNIGWIGHFSNAQDNIDADMGIISVADPGAWAFGQPWITVNPNQGGHTANDTYVIYNTGTPTLGTRVCITAGNYPGTTCGSVVNLSHQASGTNGLYKTDNSLCTMGGDSGSPMFSYGVAYGIHIAGWDGRHCNAPSSFQSINTIGQYMGVYLLVG